MPDWFIIFCKIISVLGGVMVVFSLILYLINQWEHPSENPDKDEK